LEQTNTEEQYVSTIHEKKSLTSVLAFFKEKQFVKNPFSKSFKAKRVSDTLLVHMLLFHGEESVSKRTETEESELLNKETSKVPEYKFEWTKEVIRNFKKIKKT
jgi:hypothetical protein